MLPCRGGGCRALVEKSGFCPACKLRKGRQRELSHRKMYGRRWYAETRLFLRVNPICVGLPDGTHHWKCNGAATLVDHLIPHRGDLEVFWQTDGWRAMNRHCHDLKTLLHDGGFGRERRPPTEGTP